MGLAIDNRTKFAALPLFVANEHGQPLLAVVAKATFTLTEREPQLAEKQLPVEVAGKYWGDPLKSSYKYEPETAFTKLATDVVLIGHAYPQKKADTRVDVSMKVGPIQKTLRVFGDRQWVKRLGITDMTNPAPLEPVPLIYERAFGGWDSAEPDFVSGHFEARNPVGCGFRRKDFEEGLPLPNIEDPRHPLRTYGQSPPPAGVGFVGPNWEPRSKLAGTYDKKWQSERAPLLPTDFDARFFNAASDGCVANGYLIGTETVTLENVSPRSSIAFRLPGVAPPIARVGLRNLPDVRLETKLDTVIINVDESQLLLLWRSHVLLKNGPHDVTGVELSAES